MSVQKIRLRGARQNNLRGIDLDLPLGARIAVTGPSGSGKSSLAFDTLAREGLRRFLEALAFSSPSKGSRALERYARIERPKFDRLDGMPAVIAVSQDDLLLGPRSTLGTVAGVAPSLRALWATCGEMSCPKCGAPQVRVTTADLAALLMRKHAERAVRILAPLGAAGIAVTAEQWSALPARGILKLWAATPGGGEELRLDEDAAMPAKGMMLFALVDRLVVRADQGRRIAEALETAVDWGGGRPAVESGGEIETFATARACAQCAAVLPERSPRLLSTAAGPGACPSCKGTTTEGAGECAACAGSGLSPAGRSIRWTGLTMADALRIEASDLRARCASAERPANAAAREILADVDARLAALEALGLGTLTLSRRAATLSTGELQRARCAAAFGARVRGALYILDEPTIGCHPAEREKLLHCLDEAAARDNTLLVVEHDRDVIESCDYVVELGPGGGSAGGMLLFAGAAADAPSLRAENAKDTNPRAAEPAGGADGGVLRVVGARGRHLQNVDATFRLGRLTVVCGVSGSGKSSLVFGTLGAAARRALQGESLAAEEMLPHDRVEGLEQLSRRVVVGPRLPARRARSNPATMLGVGGELRELLALTTAAKARGWNASHFTANRSGWRAKDAQGALEGGRCEACAGLGYRELEMELAQSCTAPCIFCDGTGFAASTLEVRWRGRNIADWLALSIVEAAKELASIPKVASALAPAVALGLGYLRLGEPSDRISGGELKRLHIARELAVAARSTRALVLLDEPTRGLHSSEIDALLRALRTLAQRGDCVVVVEHHLGVIAAADDVLELGPGGGARGGRVVAHGSPQEVERADTPTGAALRASASRRAERRSPRSTAPAMPAALRVRGARVPPLKAVDVDFVSPGMNAVGGPAGSGKTSLVFGVVAAEGRRRFLSTLALSERRALERADAADVDAVEGVGAVIALRDLPGGVPFGDAAGLTHAVAQWLAEFGTRYCPNCDVPLSRRDAAGAAAELGARHPGAWLRVLAPWRVPSDIDFAAALAPWRSRGYVRALAGGRETRIDALRGAPGDLVEWIVDRIELRGDFAERLREAVEEASAVTNGRFAAEIAATSAFDAAVAREDYDRLGGCVRCGFRLERALRFEDFTAAPRSAAAAAVRIGGERAGDGAWTLATLGTAASRAAESSSGAERAAAEDVRSRAERCARFVSSDERLDRDDGAPPLRAAWMSAAGAASPPGTTLLFDDPTRGLNEAHAQALVAEMHALASGGRTVIAASSDPLVADASDHVVVLGPGGGRDGGAVVAAGPQKNSIKNSIKRADGAGESAAALGARELEHAAAALRPGVLSIVHGELGRRDLAPLLDASARRSRADAMQVVGAGLGTDDEKEATVAERLGVLAPLADQFARTAAARVAGFDAARYSLHGARSGRCGVCRGAGVVAVDAHFLPDEEVRCSACEGKRFDARTLEARVYGKNVGEWLELEVREAATLLEDHPRMAEPLRRAGDLGLGALELGRRLRAASPSEAAMLELASVLGGPPRRVLCAGVFDGKFGAERERVLAALTRAAESGFAVLAVDARGGAPAPAARKTSSRSKIA